MKSHINIVNLKNLLFGFLLTLPLMILGIIAGNEIEPFFPFFKIPGPRAFMQNPNEFVALIISLQLLVASIVVILLPLIRKGKDRRHRIYIINLIVAVIIFGYFVMLMVVWILMMFGF